jgi:hypothetical protein
VLPLRIAGTVRSDGEHGLELLHRLGPSSHCVYVALPPPLAPPVSRLTALTVFPLHYGRKKKQYLVWYHVLVWGISSLSCVPAIATNQIGMSTDGTCWFLGDYVWCFWAVWYMFVGFSIPGIIALYLRLRQFNATTDSVTDPAPLLTLPPLIVPRSRCPMCGW